MNEINLRGIIRNITDSHTIGNVIYQKADVITKRKDGKEDTVNIRFKKFCNKYTNDQEISITGNIRSFSEKTSDNRNKVSIYVFTYFDDSPNSDESNLFTIDGRICNIDELRYTNNGKCHIHFTLANNIISENGNKKFNSYIPCVAWGNIARDISRLKVNDKIKIQGELHSREYKKIVGTDPIGNEEVEFKVAHEAYVSYFEVEE